MADQPSPTATEDYFADWSRIHGGVQPRGIVAWWLRGMHTVAAPLARTGVSPSTLTLAGLVVAAIVPCLSAIGGRWLIGAGLVVGASAVLDGLDGAVALLAGRLTSWGYLLDSLVDRGADLLYLLAFRLAGAPVWPVVAAGAALFLLEYARARAANAGRGELDVVTVGERPTRVIVAAVFLGLAGVFPFWAGDLVWIGAAATAAVAGIGLVQLLVAARRLLRP